MHASATSCTEKYAHVMHLVTQELSTQHSQQQANQAKSIAQSEKWTLVQSAEASSQIATLLVHLGSYADNSFSCW